MHRSLMSMQDLPIVSEQGLRLGVVQDALFDPFEQRIVALGVDWENDPVRGPEDLLPLTQISELTADIVTVPNELAVSAGLEYEFQFETEGLIAVFADLVGTPVSLTGDGAIGTLVDLQFDPRDGSVSAYEVAGPGSESNGEPTMMISPRPAIAFQPGAIVLPAASKPDLARHPVHEEASPGSVAFLDPVEEDDLVGEDDIEVRRSNTTQPY